MSVSSSSRSWFLTLVILSVPVLVFIQALSQRLAGPLVAAERSHTAVSATLVERAINALTTVKAFNAQAFEVSVLSKVLDKMQVSTTKVNAVWRFTSALSQFSSITILAQGFWFGTSLVRKGTVSAGVHALLCCYSPPPPLSLCFNCRLVAKACSIVY